MPQHILRSSMCSTSRPINHEPSDTSSLAYLCNMGLQQKKQRVPENQSLKQVVCKFFEIIWPPSNPLVYLITYEPIYHYKRKLYNITYSYWLMEMYVARSFEIAYICPVACRKYLFPASPNFQCSGSWYLTFLEKKEALGLIAPPQKAWCKSKSSIIYHQCKCFRIITFEQEQVQISYTQCILWALNGDGQELKLAYLCKQDL